AESAALWDSDEGVWRLWDMEARALAALAASDPAAAAARRRKLAPAIAMCFETIYEGGWVDLIE
ncbi:MAG: hypothetical protein EBU46_20580, partial [Nitrosomonadaceae bacterium]|nr:hypothetical protein [Nitrosomonadaceae bacterium]